MQIVDVARREEIFEQIIQILHRISGISEGEISKTSTFDELDLDSLSRIELLVEIEREFDLDIPDDTGDEELIQKIHSVAEAVQFVIVQLTSEKAV